MKRFIAAAIAMAMAAYSFAQVPDDFTAAIKSRLENNKVLFDFHYSINGSVPLQAQGTVIMQGDCYFASCGDTRIFCNGTDRWTLDGASHEAYVEDCNSATDFLEQPEQYLQNVYDFQTSEDSFKGVWADPATGTEAAFVISGIMWLPASDDTGVFSFSEESLGSEWIVTDLRQ